MRGWLYNRNTPSLTPFSRLVFPLIQYLNTYVTSGKLESKWVAFIGSMRSKRDVNQYGFEPPASTDEIETSLQVTAQFIDRMDSLKKMR